MTSVFAYDRSGYRTRSVARGPTHCEELRFALNGGFKSPSPFPQRLAGLFYMGLASWAVIGAAGAIILG